MGLTLFGSKFIAESMADGLPSKFIAYTLFFEVKYMLAYLQRMFILMMMRKELVSHNPICIPVLPEDFTV